MKHLKPSFIMQLMFCITVIFCYVFTGCDSNPSDDSGSSNPTPVDTRRYTVIFISNGGSPVARYTGIPHNSTISFPPEPVRGGYIFAGWYTDEKTLIIPFTEQTIITKDITVYAKWNEGYYSNGTLPDVSLDEKLRIIADRADTNTIYDIPVSVDIISVPYDITTRGKNVIIKIHSASMSDIKKISISEPSVLWNISGNVTLILEDIIIQGLDNNEYPMIEVYSGGTLELGNSAKIVDNINLSSTGGAVFINGGGKMIIDGGEISGNEAYHTSAEAQYGYGGGVFINENGYLLMKSGKISNNGALWGGGVCIMNGMFIMNGGEISNNRAWAGGGVFLRLNALYDTNIYFEKKPALNSNTSGIIYDNEAYGWRYSETLLTSQVAFWNSYRVGAYGPVFYRSSPLGQNDVISTKSSRDSVWEGEGYADSTIY